MPENEVFPCSPRIELEGIIYLPRMLEKIRLMHAGILHPDLHANLGRAMDLWTCQFLGVEYQELRAQVIAGATDENILCWAREHGITRPDFELAWFNSHLRNFGYRDSMSERLEERKKEAPHTDRADILSFIDYIEVDEGRTI